jgi:hypothetical protein
MLKGVKDINSNDNINRLSNKDAMNPSDIFCCLMHHVPLAKINAKFSEYICHYNELVDMTVLVDESDLMSPTSSNDGDDKNDTTACEILLAKIYKKVKYALHITGTAHSLLYNITTKLTEKTYIQIKISKVHKMKRTEDYFGLFSNSIHFNTDVNTWWEKKDKLTNKSPKYTSEEDYDINIREIIKKILARPKTNKYNSFLISEEKIKTNQLHLAQEIIKDFSELFVLVYHGNCLRLYLSKKYEDEIKRWSEWDSNQASTSKRLWQIGGVFGSPITTEKFKTLPNDYCYFDINPKILNIKFVYKLLRILFEKSEIPLTNKTIITITGKYGERGYSFTSDDYGEYSLHLTDQYFVSHASFNCTDISQRLRLQGKYSDEELKNHQMQLTLWTTSELKDIVQNFYVNFIKEIEKYIMVCENWEEIRELLESIIDNGAFKFSKYMKYIDVAKKRKNIKIVKHFDQKKNGYKLFIVDDLTDFEIINICKEKQLPNYVCINDIQSMPMDEFIEKHGECKIEQVFCELPEFNIDEINEIIRQVSGEYNKQLNPVDKKWVEDRSTLFAKNGCILERVRGNLHKIKKIDLENSNDITRFGEINDGRRVNICYGEQDELYLCITFRTKEKMLPKETNDYINKTPFATFPERGSNLLRICESVGNERFSGENLSKGVNVKYSVIKEKYRQANTNASGYENEDEFGFISDGLPSEYYWKTPDGWLYLHKSDKQDITSLCIIAPVSPAKNELSLLREVDSEPVVDNTVMLFAQSCCKPTNQKNLRFGLKDVYKIYELWCKTNGKDRQKLKTQKKFKEEFEKLNYKEESSKGVDIENNRGKRGYNIMVSLN